MDAYEATKTVLSRIQTLDPENASKIMGYILIQDQGEKEMIRLAFGPETVLISVINQAKARLGLLSNTSSSPSTHATKFSPFPRPSPRIMIPNNGFPFSPPSSPWSNGSPPVFSRSPGPVVTTSDSSSLSYAAVVNGGGSTNAGSVSLGFDDYGSNQVFCESFDPVMSPSGRSDSVVFCEENSHQNQFHRRSFSVNDVFFGGSDDNGNNSGFGGWRPCMYYARGFCKNGDGCKFVHDGGFGDYSPIGSPSKIDCVDELLRVKALQQQQQQHRFAQFMASGGRHPLAYHKCMNILNDNERSAAAALMMSDEFHKYGRSRPDGNEFSAMALGENSNSCARQIYLTFPADSTFKEEDVSNYFSLYGPVHDVRIPYQLKRMFGFVTFIYPETVKLILAKGNPHFVCDSRVLVKPYKEKGKILDKKQLQLQLQQLPIDSGELSSCLSPSGLESRELYNIPYGARMFHNSHEMMLRRRLEQDTELQQAIELQGRRLMNMQLMEMKNQEVLAENNGVLEPAEPPADAAGEKVPQEMPHVDNGNGSFIKEQDSNTDDSDHHQESSLEHILPDNLFASPTKAAAEQHSAFSSASAESNDSSPITAAATNTTANNIPTFNMASLKSCYFQMPRFTSGQEATET